MKKIFSFLKLIRSVNLLFVTLSISFFYYLIVVPAHKHKLFTTLLPFSDMEFALFVLSIFLVASAGSVIYDFYNFERDKEFKSDLPLPQGTFTLDAAIYLHAIFAFAGIGLGFYLGYKTNNFKIGYIYVTCVVALYGNAAYLKKIPFAGNAVVAALYGFVFVILMLFEVTFLNTITFAGARYVLDILLWQMKFYGGFVFLIMLACEIVKDIENSEADEAHNIDTLAIQYGDTIAKIVAVIVLVVLLAGLGFFMKSFVEARAIKEFSYLATFVVLPLLVAIVLIFLAKEKKQYSRIALLLKAISFLGILSIPAFYLFNK